MSLNIVGIVLAAIGRFPYADYHAGAFVLGNLVAAVLFRNELFLRFLYLVANTCLAKVCNIYPHP